MSTQIVGFSSLKENKEEVTEELLKEKINNLEEVDEDEDGVVLDMSDLSDIAEAMALIKAGLDKISNITQVDVSDEAVSGIINSLSQH